MMMNSQIRLTARRRGVPLRLVAELLNISEPTLYRHLNKRMTPAERERYLSAIMRLSEGTKNE
ncbi:MAG: hypothetical protein E7325_00990 [Clostridiales bacterium]|nr:hypothetical protein [Clostridiales bacterium]